MFQDRSLRIVAGLLLWSVGWVLLSVAIHGRLFGVALGSEDAFYVRTLSRSVILGAFLGIPFGALLNIAEHPALRNYGASLGALMAVSFAPRLAVLPFPFALERCYSAIIYGTLLASIFSIIAASLDKKAAPFGAKDKD